MGNENTSPNEEASQPKSIAPEGVASWLPIPLTVIQAIAAFATLSEPLKTIVFIVTISGTMIAVQYIYKSIPKWSVAALLFGVAVYFLTSSSGRAWLQGTSQGKASQSSGAENGIGLLAQPSIRFVTVSVFRDVDEDGIQSPTEPPLPGVLVEIRDGELRGMVKRLDNSTGTTSPQQVLTRGSVVVTICGVSQVHAVSIEHSSEARSLLIPIGIEDEVVTGCKALGT
jgi:hypothetical protein